MAHGQTHIPAIPEQENTHKNLSGDAQEKAIAEEMVPFAVYAAIPIMITIAIAYFFGVR
jgi:hypothetical protein